MKYCVVESIKMRLRAFSVPALITLASLLQLNYVASNAVSPAQIVRPLILLWLLLILLGWPAYWLTRDWEWASLLLTVFVMGFYLSPEFFSTLLLLIILGTIPWLIVNRLRRARLDIRQFNSLLLGLSLLLIGYAAFRIGDMLLKVPWSRYNDSLSKVENYSLPQLQSPFEKPDIYYIVLDEYARSDVLQELFKFDNSEFVGFLEGHHFVVPDQSRSNYPATQLSIASTLNMDYIQAFAPGLDDSHNRWLMGPFLDHSRVRALLEAQGYRSISFGIDWSITDNPTTDVYLQPFPVMLNDFEGFLLDVTPLGISKPALDKFVSVPSAATHRQVVSYTFETLKNIGRIAGPKFVFAHIISPHPPFVFDAEGNPADAEYPFTMRDANEYPGSMKEFRAGYVEQLQFVNKSLEAIVDAILAGSATAPIIILQGDHGTGLYTDFTSSKDTCVWERFSAFAAYYLPGVESSSIPHDISTVNLFRLVLNEYFAAGLPLLEDRQYFYQETLPGYQFEDVTDRLNEECSPSGK
jgi:hypothetical protein